ncbi:MAG: EAL domain-containing protein, partial [Nitrospirota bacterium]|nr:EAL domain-containing protein [Nitrospirota bacterium]
TYLCVHAFAKAANMAGSTDPEDLVEKLQHISVTGPQGIVDMNPLIHHAKVSTYLARCEADGTFTIIEKFGRIDPVIPERYMIEAGLHQSMPPATPDRQFSTKPIIPVADRQMGIANIDTKGRFVHVTDDFCALFNKNDSEILSEETLLSLAFPHEIDEGAYLFTQLLSGSLSHVEGHCSAEGSDGILRHLHFDIATARNPSQICSFVMRVWPYHLISELGRPLPDEPEPATREPHLTAIAIVAKNGWIAYANNSFLKLWGYSRLDEVLGSDIASFWVAGKGIHDLLLLADSSSEWTGELAAQTRQGLRKQLRVTIERSDGEENQAWGYTLSCVEPRASLSQGRADDSTSGRILSVAEIAILSTDQEGVIFQASRHAASLFGYSEEELVGMSVHTLVPPRFRERHRGHFTRFLQSPISELPMASSRSEVGGYRKDGSEFPAEASLSKFRGADGWVVVITLMDVTEKKKTEKELIWQATHDPLTLLPNRSLMRDRLINALERSKRPQSMVALLFIDLDGFKLINDTYGHESGDSILTTIGDKLVQIVRPGDTVARFGGDEFVILCEQISDETAIPALATRIIEELRQPFRFNGHELFVTASIGLAYGSGQTHTADELIRNADAAMYTAKEEGRDGWRIYNENIHEKVRNQLTIAHGLRAAIERNEFELYLQPVVDTMENRIIGAEALLRWHPPFGEVPPSQFIPVAEMTGAITSIGMWVFEQACLLQKRIVEQRGEASSFFISVNVSTRQLSEKGFVGQITRVLERTGAVPEDIVVEITETALMSDIEMNLMALQELGKLGLKLAVDDFGTGYSSLGQLIRMPVDKLKIDRIFVDGMFRQDSARSIVAAIVNMASALGLAVIAEGVETREHVEGLKALGCGLAQGYYFARPMTTQDFETFALREN